MTIDPSLVQKILVIKLSALGDFVISFRSFEAIRKQFPNAEIILLTTRPYHRLALASNWFNKVWVDERPKVGQLIQLLRLRSRMIQARFDLVVDLQNNDRTSMYYHLMVPNQPVWSGVARGCIYYHSRRRQKKWHPIDREADQLTHLGITPLDRPDLKWLNRAVGGKSYRINKETMLVAAGCSAAHPEKRWPADQYAKISKTLVKRGWQVFLIGTQEDADVNAEIKSLCPEARDFTGKTNLLELAAMGQQAGCAVGNDTGPMHLLANCGCKSLVLFGGKTHPEINAPRGSHVHTLQKSDIGLIESKEVLKILGKPGV